MPAYETAEDAVRTYVYMWNYERNLQLQYETPSELRLDEAPPKNHLKAMVRRVCSEGGFILSEEDSTEVSQELWDSDPEHLHGRQCR